MEDKEVKVTLEDLMKKLDNTCGVCNGKGYHIENDIDYDGWGSRVKISCYCCDGKGVK